MRKVKQKARDTEKADMPINCYMALIYFKLSNTDDFYMSPLYKSVTHSREGREGEPKWVFDCWTSLLR